ncbi:hypothetical protein WR25_22294 [Diploscapter pachys]|uniref:Uncharacterized protein n=1 Tax=Diploscapter pachys TaxID=2018661 RepID=A0A2A2JU53_9BILA|nr:hypothetical protein WR25_22294 [Diploscapter pachys]
MQHICAIHPFTIRPEYRNSICLSTAERSKIEAAIELNRRSCRIGSRKEREERELREQREKQQEAEAEGKGFGQLQGKDRDRLAGGRMMAPETSGADVNVVQKLPKENKPDLSKTDNLIEQLTMAANESGCLLPKEETNDNERSILISLGLDYNTSLDLRDSSSERMESENGIDESKPYQELEQITESPPPSNTVGGETSLTALLASVSSPQTPLAKPSTPATPVRNCTPPIFNTTSASNQTQCFECGKHFRKGEGGTEHRQSCAVTIEEKEGGKEEERTLKLTGLALASRPSRQEERQREGDRGNLCQRD